MNTIFSPWACNSNAFSQVEDSALKLAIDYNRIKFKWIASEYTSIYLKDAWTSCGWVEENDCRMNRLTSQNNCFL